MDEHNPSTSVSEGAAALSASALRELQHRAQAALAASREQAARLEADITRQLDTIAATLNEQTTLESRNASEADSLHAEIHRLTGELESSRTTWLAERAELELQRDDLFHKLAALETQLESSRAEIARLTGELENSLAARLTERSELELQRDALSGKVAAVEAQLESSQTEWRNQLLDFENRLREQQNSWQDQRADWNATRAAIERERDELQQKFDLALQDVQRLRARVAELEQELARRPETHQADSAELVALRAERDALAARVEQLDGRPAPQIDPNVEQQLSDLQRRFELAVEDVRELKTKNARLESQLAASAAKSKSQSPADVVGMDWESQKRRLLAALEESSSAQDAPVQKKERVTIEATIEMTDAVVAEKDRQIADLQTQLAAGVEGAACQIDHNPKVKELIDNDEVIAEHRKRVQDLEREMEQKLRTAELEISVERAKMARQKMELDELKSDLESRQQDFEMNGGPAAQGQPKRRWRSKLGLTGDE